MPELTLAGIHWPAGEAGIREVLGRLRAFRHFCCPAEGDAEPAAAEALQRVAELGVAERLSAGLGVAGLEPREALVHRGVSVDAVGPPWKRRRAEVSSVEIGPAPFALRPYVGHSAVFVGRSLWCLKCFEVPGRIFQTWRHGRCDGSRPAVAMPPSLRDAILRAPFRPELPTDVHERWAELATFAHSRQLK